MLVSRSSLKALAIADVILFLLASAFNDHSSTSVDGILWWLALLGFALLVLAGCAIVVQWVRSRRRRPRRT